MKHSIIRSTLIIILVLAIIMCGMSNNAIASGNDDIYDMWNDPFGYEAGYLNWAGSEDRAYLILYVVDRKGILIGGTKPLVIGINRSDSIYTDTKQNGGADFRELIYKGSKKDKLDIATSNKKQDTDIYLDSNGINLKNYGVNPELHILSLSSKGSDRQIQSILDTETGNKSRLQSKRNETILEKLLFKYFNNNAEEVYKCIITDEKEPEYLVVIDIALALCMYKKQDGKNMPETWYDTDVLRELVEEKRAQYKDKTDKEIADVIIEDTDQSSEEGQRLYKSDSELKSYIGTRRNNWSTAPNPYVYRLVNLRTFITEFENFAGSPPTKDNCANYKWLSAMVKNLYTKEKHSGISLKVGADFSTLKDAYPDLSEAKDYMVGRGVAKLPEFWLGTCINEDNTGPCTEEKVEIGTKGRCTVIKLYYTKYNDGTYKKDSVLSLSRGGRCTNKIDIESEEKEYTLKKWLVTDTDSIASKEEMDGCKNVYETGTTSCKIKLLQHYNTEILSMDNKLEEQACDSVLVVYYEKQEEKEEEPPVDEEHQFEIGESQIARRIDFSQSQLTNTGLCKREIKWTAPAFECNATCGEQIGVTEDGKPIYCGDQYEFSGVTDSDYKLTIRVQNWKQIDTILSKYHEIRLLGTNRSEIMTPNLAETLDGNRPNSESAYTTRPGGKFNIHSFVFRGDDPVTLAKWKNTSANRAISKIVELITNEKIKSKNELTGKRKKEDFFIRKFDTVFCDDANTDHLTSARYTLSCGHKGPIDVPSLFDNGEVKATVSNIKVKVNVFWGEKSTAKANSKLNDVAKSLYAGFVTCRPYIKMRTDINVGEENADGASKANNLFVLSDRKEELTAIQFNNYVEVGVNKTPEDAIKIDSTQFSTHDNVIERLARSFSVDRNEIISNIDKYRALPGGATFIVSIPKSAVRTVTVTSYQAYLPSGGLGYKQMEVTGGKTSLLTSEEDLKDAHDSFVDTVVGSFSTTSIREMVALNAQKDIKSGQYRRVCPGDEFNGAKLNTDTKYYFNGYLDSVLDIHVNEPSYKYITFFVNTEGNICYVSGKTAPQEGNGDGIVAMKGSDNTSNTIALKLGIVTNFRNALVDNEGNDTDAAWARDGKWFNEAFDGVTYLIATTTFEIGLWNPADRQSVLDPKLMPKQESKDDLVIDNNEDSKTKFNTLYFQTWNTMKTAGTIVTPVTGSSYTVPFNYSNLYRSRVIYIPNIMVQDLN